MTELALRRALVDAARRLDQRGLLAGREGNLSVRLPRGRVLVTPAGRPKHALRPADLIVVGIAEARRWRTAAAGGAPAHRRVPSAPRPSSEFSMHACIYAAHPGVAAVVHAHPPVASGAAGWPVPLPWARLAEVRQALGGVVAVPVLPPGTVALGEAVAAALGEAGAVLLTDHGATTVGGSVEEALARMESLEQAARLLVIDAVGRWIGQGCGTGRAAPDAPLAQRTRRTRDG
jgi:L-fuculose-phosphate aldolase